jgi:hypothetical protein
VDALTGAELGFVGGWRMILFQLIGKRRTLARIFCGSHELLKEDAEDPLAFHFSTASNSALAI